MNQKIIAKAEAAIAKRAVGWNENSGYCTVTTIDENGYPSSSTITASKADGIRRLVFGSTLNSDIVNRIKKCNRACVCINSDEYYVSLVGTTEILTDPQAKQDAWYDRLKEYYSGADAPDFCALRFTTERYNLYFIDGELKTRASCQVVDSCAKHDTLLSCLARYDSKNHEGVKHEKRGCRKSRGDCCEKGERWE